MSATEIASAIEGAITGKPCWYVHTYDCMTPTFVLSMGRRIERPQALGFFSATEEFRRYTGEINIFVWCAWRLESFNDLLVGSYDNGTPITMELMKLIGASIQTARIRLPAWDLDLDFSNGLTLRLFADHVYDEQTSRGNWDVETVENAYCAGPGAEMRIESRNLR